MEEQTPQTIRPTKKQQELLEFLSAFINERGYGPSYREIMIGCNYTSVATVAVHVRNLISRGHLRKNGRSARSLEIVGDFKPVTPKLQTNQIKPVEEKWLTDKVDYIFKQIEETKQVDELVVANLQTIVDALKILGLEGPSLSFKTRLNDLKNFS